MAWPILAKVGSMVGGKALGGTMGKAAAGGGKGGGLSGLLGKGGGEGGGIGKMISGGKGVDLAKGGLTALVGAGQAIKGAIDQKRADASLPARESYLQRKNLNKLERTQAALETGTSSNASRNALNQMTTSGVKQAMQYGAGAKGLNAMSRMYSEGLTNLNESDQDKSLSVGKDVSALSNAMAQRDLELGMEVYDRGQARAASTKTKGNRNLMGGLSSMAGSLKSGDK